MAIDLPLVFHILHKCFLQIPLLLFLQHGRTSKEWQNSPDHWSTKESHRIFPASIWWGERIIHEKIIARAYLWLPGVLRSHLALQSPMPTNQCYHIRCRKSLHLELHRDYGTLRKLAQLFDFIWRNLPCKVKCIYCFSSQGDAPIPSLQVCKMWEFKPSWILGQQVVGMQIPGISNSNLTAEELWEFILKQVR